MRRLATALVLTVLSLPALATMPDAAGAGSTVVLVDGPGASAAWRFVSPDRCTVGDTFVNLATGAAPAGSGPSAPQTWIWIFESTADKCHSTTTQELATPDAGVALAPGAFQVDRAISAATLDAVVPVTDRLTGAAHTLTLHLSWTGRGDLIRSNGGSRFHDAFCTFGSHGTETDRNATVSGTTREGGAEYAGYTSVEASLSSVRGGAVEVGCDTSSPGGGMQEESPVRGLSAGALFEHTDDCISTYADVAAYDEADDQSAKAPHTYVVYLDAIEVDTCQDVAVAAYRSGFYGAAIPNGSLHIDDELATATLDVPGIPVIDLVHYVYATVDLHLTWTASSPPDRFTEGFHSHTPYCNVAEHSQGVARTAVATGTMGDGTTEFAGTSEGAQLESIKSPGSTVGRSC
jgi:hypothetical protein